MSLSLILNDDTLPGPSSYPTTRAPLSPQHGKTSQFVKPPPINNHTQPLSPSQASPFHPLTQNGHDRPLPVAGDKLFPTPPTSERLTKYRGLSPVLNTTRESDYVGTAYRQGSANYDPLSHYTDIYVEGSKKRRKRVVPEMQAPPPEPEPTVQRRVCYSIASFAFRGAHAVGSSW